MNVLPLIHRELLVGARRPMTWWLRLGVGVVTGLCFFVVATLAPNQQTLGISLFSSLTVIAFILTILAGTRYAAVPLCEENRENTLGLLLLTPLRRWELVLGKLVGATTGCAGALATFVPLLTLSLLAGGVAFNQVWMAGITLVVMLTFSNVAGLYIAAIQTDELRVEFTSLALAILSCLPLGWLILSVMLTVEMDVRVQRGNFLERPQTIWDKAAVPILWLPFMTLFVTCLMTGVESTLAFFGNPAYLLFIALSQGSAYVFALNAAGALWLIIMMVWMTASRLGIVDLGEREARTNYQIQTQVPVTRSYDQQSQASSANPATTATASPSQSSTRPAHLLDVGPLVWLLHPPEPRRRLIWVSAVLIGLAHFFPLFHWNTPLSLLAPLLVPVWLVAIFLNPMFDFLVAWQASRLFSEARRSGSLELLLVTPGFRVKAIRQIWQSLRMTFFKPIAVLLAFQLIGGLADPRYDRDFGSQILFSTQSVVIGIAGKIMSLTALAWMGIWQGWSSPRPSLAAIKTFFIVSLLPSILYLPFFGVGLLWGGQGLIVGFAQLFFTGILFLYASHRVRNTILAGAAPVELRRN